MLVFGAESLPVKLHSAVRETRAEMHLLHDKDRVRLRREMVCPAHERAVPREHILKGFEVSEGRHVILSDEEMDSLAPAPERVMEVPEFVRAEEMDPRCFDRAYYLSPDGDDEGYATLAAALSGAGRVGVCRWTLRRRPCLGALGASGGTLLLTTMRYGSEVVPVERLDLAEVEADAAQLAAAERLVAAMAGEFRPEEYHDEYEPKLMAFLEHKARGEATKMERPTRPVATRPGLLLETLRASLKDMTRRKGEPRKRRRTA
jgi:DNA end-binding protein Ku